MTLSQIEAPNADSAADGNGAERRVATRTMTIYRLVQVACDGDEGFGRCRNISDTGMRLDVKMAVAVNKPVRVTFSPTFSLFGRVVWKSGSECGIQFDGPIDCAELLRRSASETHADGAREPRLKVELPARMLIDGRNCPTTVSDISQHGMKLQHDGRLLPGLRVWVILQGAEKAGVVRWVRGSMAGVFLLEPFSVDDLGSMRSL